MKADYLGLRGSLVLRSFIAAGASLLFFAGAANVAGAQSLPMLHTSGLNIVDANGNTVSLRGVNLGGWLTIETWMTPADSSGLPDNYSIIMTLDNRFGVATEQNLLQTYEQHWITSGRCLDVPGASTANGVHLQLYDCNGTGAQSWRLVQQP